MATKKKSHVDELREEYDFGTLEGGVRGKYHQQAQSGTNIVLLDPDVAKAFPTQESVNEALRLLVKVAETTSSGAPKKRE